MNANQLEPRLQVSKNCRRVFDEVMRKTVQSTKRGNKIKKRNDAIIETENVPYR